MTELFEFLQTTESFRLFVIGVAFLFSLLMCTVAFEAILKSVARILQRPPPAPVTNNHEHHYYPGTPRPPEAQPEETGSTSEG